MADEIEKKYRLTESARRQVVDALEKVGARYAGEDFEENIIFAGGDLIENQAVLRLRRVGEKTILTYKRRLSGESAVKHHAEYETLIDDFPIAVEIFANLGFRPSLVYEKRRRTFHLGAAEIVLDRLSFGDYMEIEGTPETIEETEARLGAGGFEVEHDTYPQLVRKFGRQNGEMTEARFEAGEEIK